LTAREHGGVWSDYTFATTGHAEHDPVINLRSGPTGMRRQAISEGSVRQGAREVVHTPVSFGLGNDAQDFIRSEIALFDQGFQAAYVFRGRHHELVGRTFPRHGFLLSVGPRPAFSYLNASYQLIPPHCINRPRGQQTA
jgi:hypothetical protein